jgi:hypothetical protein
MSVKWPPIQKAQRGAVLSTKAGHILKVTRQGKGWTRGYAAGKIGVHDHVLRSVEQDPGKVKTRTVLKVLAFYRLQLKDICL